MRSIVMGLAVGVTLAAWASAASAREILSPADRQVNQATPLIIGGCFEAAEPLLRRALALDPRDAEARYNLGVVLRATGRPAEAVIEYRAAARLFPADDAANRAKSLYGAALAMETLGDPARAAAAWRDYVVLDGRFAAAQPAVAIARQHLAMEEALAQRRERPPGTQKATR